MSEPIKVKGIVVKSVDYKDNDKMLTFLCDKLGRISVCAKGVKSLKNKNSPAASALCYSELVLKKAGEMYSLVSADVIESFYPLRESVEALSYGIYFAQLAAMCISEDVEAEEELRLLLNTLFILSKYPERAKVLCASFELKLCEFTGLCPIVGDCACSNAAEYFDCQEGECYCKNCKTPSSIRVSAGALRVMEYILSSPLKEALLFDTPAPIAEETANLTERFMLFHLGKLPKSLDYLKKLK